MKVLVIDDDRAFLDMVRSVLLEEGHEVLAAADGQAGLAVAQRSPPDVILLDVRMPRMDGPAFARAYNRLPGAHAPIIVLSALPHGDESGVRDAVAHLSKPFELDVLTDLLRQADQRLREPGIGL